MSYCFIYARTSVVFFIKIILYRLSYFNELVRYELSLVWISWNPQLYRLEVLDSEPRLVVFGSSGITDPVTMPFCSPADVFGLAPLATLALAAGEGLCGWLVATGGFTLAVVVRTAGARWLGGVGFPPDLNGGNRSILSFSHIHTRDARWNISLWNI